MKWETVPTFDILSTHSAETWSFCEPLLVRLDTDHDGTIIQRLRTYGLSRRSGGPVLMAITVFSTFSNLSTYQRLLPQLNTVQFDGAILLDSSRILPPSVLHRPAIHGSASQ